MPNKPANHSVIVRQGGVIEGPTDPDHPGDLINAEQPVAPMAINYMGPAVREWHHHQRAQLLYSITGVMQVATANGTWVVAPEQAVWVPPSIEHQVSHHSGIAMRTLYIDPGSMEGLPADCCVISVTPLLQQLILRATEFGHDYQQHDKAWRLMMVILDELKTIQPAPMHLPRPRDQRLVKIVELLIQHPDDRRTLKQFAQTSGASERTLARLFNQQTGMTFGKWRERLRLMDAVRRLVEGESITTVALDLGYRSSSAFITMFKKNTGMTPMKYIKAEHKAC